MKLKIKELEFMTTVYYYLDKMVTTYRQFDKDNLQTFYDVIKCFYV